MIELLIIVAAVLVVAACMAPMFLHAKAEAAREKCLDNLRALGGALIQYSASNDDTLPMARYPKGTRPSSFAMLPAYCWADLMRSYIPQGSKYACPADNPRTTGVLSYALNAYFYIQPAGVDRQELSGGGLSEVPDVPTKLLIIESTPGNRNEMAMPGSLPPNVWTRHLNGANWTFGDAHAEFHVPPKSWDNQAAWQDPNKAAKQNYPQWFPWATGKPTWQP